MSRSDREALVRLAREFDALVVTDDVYDFLQWPSDPEKPLDGPATGIWTAARKTNGATS